MSVNHLHVSMVASVLIASIATPVCAYQGILGLTATLVSIKLNFFDFKLNQ